MKGAVRTAACLLVVAVLLVGCGEDTGGPAGVLDTGDTPLNYDPPQVIGGGQPGVVDDPAGSGGCGPDSGSRSPGGR
jgi:hypothetical protein